MIAIIDYGMGNLGSVLKSLKRINAEAIITSDEKAINTSSKIILPGVGHFGSAMKKLNQSGLNKILNENVIGNKKPILGICLGMQLMAKYSEEGKEKGLGWIDATVVEFNMKDKLKYKIPHMGWNTVINNNSELFDDIPENSLFYFVHSYYMICNNERNIIGSTTYSNSFTSAVSNDNIFGTQFHPEKSHDQGLQLLKNFVNLYE